MQRVIIDTNVLVSALIQQSYPYLLVSSILLNRDIEWCISDEILQEYYEVLKRAKFSKYPGFTAKAEGLLGFVESMATKFTPEVKLEIIKDPSDNKFLELAIACKAHFLITGNTNDFIMTSYKQTKIVTPKEYWAGRYPFI